MTKPWPSFILLLLWNLGVLSAQTPVITLFPLPAPETLDSLPLPIGLHWGGKTDGQYYLLRRNVTDLQRHSFTGTTWQRDQSPVLSNRFLSTLINTSGTTCLLATVENVGNDPVGYHRRFQILRTEHTWNEAETVFSITYNLNPQPGQPFQLPDYDPDLIALSDSVFYYKLTIVGDGGPYPPRYWYSVDAGHSWNFTEVQANFYVHNEFFALREGHFLRSSNPEFTNAVEWPLPDSLSSTTSVQGLFWALDTFYMYTGNTMRWKRTENTDWQAEQLPFCWINSLQEKQQHLYAATSDGLYQASHTQTNWKKLVSSHDEKLTFFNNNLLVLDSTDLLFYNNAQGIIHSIDGGITWQPFQRGLPERGADALSFWGDSLLSNVYSGFLNVSAEGRDWRPIFVEEASCNIAPTWLPIGAGGFMETRHAGANPSIYTDEIFYTPDRITWIPAAPLPPLQFTKLFYQQQRLWVVGLDGSFYSDNLGQYWDTLTLPNPSTGYPFSIYGWITQGDTIVFMDNDNKLHRTIDFGQNWTILSTPTLPVTIASYWIFRQKNKLLLCSNGGRIWTSSDWGDNWTQACTVLPGYTQNSLLQYSMKHDSILSMDNFLTLDAGQHWLKMTGSLVPTSSEALAWDSAWLYFSGYHQGIYRVPSGPVWTQLHQLGDSTILSTEVASTKTWHIQPNPVQTRLYLKGEVPEFSTWTIVDIMGKIVATGQLQEQSISVETLKAGVYFLKIQAGAHMEIQKFIISR